MEPNNDPIKKRYIQLIMPYQKEDNKLQIKQNKLLFWQNIFTVVLGIAQIIVAIILAIKVF